MKVEGISICTILTVNKQFWTSNKDAVIARMKFDAVSNSDGVTVTLLGVKDSKDLHMTATTLESLLGTLVPWMDEAADGARLFIHQRMATTSYVGLAFNHGFTDGLGGIIMHNGILQSKRARALAVDSYALMLTKRGPEDGVLDLMNEGETYANVFRIYPNKHSYEVIRLSVGNLYTDGNGNFSTNKVGTIETVVGNFSGQTFTMTERQTEMTKPRSYGRSGWWMGGGSGGSYSSYNDWEEDDSGYVGGNYNSYTGKKLLAPEGAKYLSTGRKNENVEILIENLPYIVGIDREFEELMLFTQENGEAEFLDYCNYYEAYSHESLVNFAERWMKKVLGNVGDADTDLESDKGRSASASDIYELASNEELVLENSEIFILWDKDLSYLCAYSQEDGTLISKEVVLLGDTTWQAQQMMAEHMEQLTSTPKTKRAK